MKHLVKDFWLFRLEVILLSNFISVVSKFAVINRIGLEKNETAPEPVLPTPRTPTTKEREQAVQISILPNSTVSEGTKKEV